MDRIAQLREAHQAKAAAAAEGKLRGDSVERSTAFRALVAAKKQQEAKAS